MSKRKKTYKINDGIYFENQQKKDEDLCREYHNNYQSMFKNNANLNNILGLLNYIDLGKLNNIISFMYNGIDINSFGDIDIPNTNKSIENINVYDSEIILNFLNSLKPILGNEFGSVVDRFIQFYIDDINKEK